MRLRALGTLLAAAAAIAASATHATATPGCFGTPDTPATYICVDVHPENAPTVTTEPYPLPVLCFGDLGCPPLSVPVVKTTSHGPLVTYDYHPTLP